MLRKQRLLGAAAVTGFWLVMVALFLYREGYLTPAPENLRNAHEFRPQDQWLGIYLDDDQRVGYLHMTSSHAEKEGIPGYQVDLRVRLETSLFGMSTKLDVTGNAWTSEAGDHAEFAFSLASGEYHMGIQGAVRDNHLRAAMQTGGEEIPLDFPVDSTLFTGGGLGLPGGALPALDVGESTSIDAFDPMTMKQAKARIECLGRETLILAGGSYETRLYATTLGAITSRAWVTADDEVIQATTPFGLTLRKIEPEVAIEPIPAGHEGDLIQSLAVIAAGPPVFVDATHLRVRVSGIDPASIPDGGPWQHREGDILDIRQPAPLPEPGANTAAGALDFDTTSFLAGDAFVASDHPKVIAQAREIVGEETDPWKQSLRLYEWMYENIEKIPVLSIPNALDVLKTRQGDCNEHAVLFAALARALDIPCRIAIGLVYSDTLGGFGYHAWPEVYCGMWYPLDPTLGQVAADATHIKLLNGDMDAWVQLAGFIGQLELEVLAVE